MLQKRAILLIILFLVGFSAYRAAAEEVFTWQDCIKEAAKNHPDLISAQESIKESQASKQITASALFPQIESSFDFSRQKAESSTSNSFSYGVSGRQLLFDGFKTSSDVQAALENIQAAEYNYNFTSSEIRLRLRSAFVNVLKAQELLKITEEIFNIRRENLELITLRYQSGMEHKGALMSAEANLAQAQFEISRAKRALEVAQRELIKEMGRAQFSPLGVEGVFQVQETALEKPDFAILANNHPSLGKLIAEKNAASLGIKSAKANFYPELSAQVGANRSSSHWPPQNDQLNAGLALSFPLFEGGLRLAEVSQAKARFNQAWANERSAKDGLIVTLEQTWVALQDALENVGVQKKFLSAIEERARIAEAQYSLGMIQFDNWTIIEDDLVSAKKAFLDVQANALLAEANWVQAKGERLEYAQN